MGFGCFCFFFKRHSFYAEYLLYKWKKWWSPGGKNERLIFPFQFITRGNKCDFLLSEEKEKLCHWNKGKMHPALWNLGHLVLLLLYLLTTVTAFTDHHTISGGWKAFVSKLILMSSVSNFFIWACFLPSASRWIVTGQTQLHNYDEVHQ